MVAEAAHVPTRQLSRPAFIPRSEPMASASMDGRENYIIATPPRSDGDSGAKSRRVAPIGSVKRGQDGLEEPRSPPKLPERLNASGLDHGNFINLARNDVGGGGVGANH